MIFLLSELYEVKVPVLTEQWALPMNHSSHAPFPVRWLKQLTPFFAFVAWSDVFPLATLIRIVIERRWMYRQFFTELTDL